MNASADGPGSDPPRRFWSGTTGRAPYFLAGVSLFALKYLIDFVVADRFFRRPWSVYRYIVHDEKILGLPHLDPDEQSFYLTLLAISIPFMAVGLLLTVRRLRSAGLSLGLAAFFFLPAPLNLLFYLTLSAWPPRSATPALRAEPGLIDLPFDRAIGQAPPAPLRFDDPSATPGAARAAAIALAITVPAGLAFCFLSVRVFSNYGWGVFVGLPFVGPMLSVLIYGTPARRTVGQCLTLGLSWFLLTGLALLVLAFEGAVCLVMLAPLALPPVLLGAWLGYLLQRFDRPRAPDVGKLAGLMLVALPSLIGAESITRPDAPVFVGRTAVEVDAPPERVWRHVVAFSELPPPDDWIFSTGIAYPVRAEIDGEGVGAVRHCIFSTGAFVEPITAWEPPRRLGFDVTDNPPPMKEWSPFLDIHPPHLDDFLIARRGEFLLVPLPDGRTRLVGTTWYRHNLWPAGYWEFWSQRIITRIHRQVLNHVKALSESP